MTRHIMREKLCPKKRLDALLKPIIGKLSERNAPGYLRNDNVGNDRHSYWLRIRCFLLYPAGTLDLAFSCSCCLRHWSSACCYRTFCLQPWSRTAFASLFRELSLSAY